MKEIWKPVKGWEGRYEVSNLGRVKSAQGKNKGKILSQNSQQGYMQVFLSQKGIGRNHLVHRLVAEAFIPNPLNLPQVNHKDETRSNNKVDNLEWCTQIYNVNYGTRLRRMSTPIVCIETDEKFDSIKNAATEFLRRGYGSSYESTSSCIQYAASTGRPRWKFHFRYL